MALRDIANETPKEFIRKSAKIYFKEVLKGAIAVAVIAAYLLIRSMTGGDKGALSGTGTISHPIPAASEEGCAH